MVSERTFTYMKAYKELGDIETKIIDILFKNEFEGNCSDLARLIKMNSSNLRKTLDYLCFLGIVIAEKEKIEERTKGKERYIMKKCYLADNWSELLVEHYKNGNITTKQKKKDEFIKGITDNA